MFLAVLMVLATAVVQRLPEGRSAASKSSPPAAGQAVLLEGSDELSMIGRLLVKMDHAVKSMGQPDPAASSMYVQQLDASSGVNPVDKLRVAIVVAELSGKEAAIERLDAIESAEAKRLETPTESAAPGGTAPDPAQSDASAAKQTPAQQAPAEAAAPHVDLRPDIQLLRKLYTEGSTTLSDDERKSLEARHGWFGRLALAFGLEDSDPARAPLIGGGGAIVAVIFAFGLGFLLALISGAVLFIVAIAMRAAGRLKPRFVPPQPGGSAYGETFVAFLMGFLAIAFFASIAAHFLPEGSVVLTAVALGSNWLLLGILFWPKLRGHSFADLRRSLGWHAPNGVFAEILAGFTGYLAGLPVFLLAVLGVVLYLFLQKLVVGHSEPPKNPLFERLASGGAPMLGLFFLMATVWAPIVEESVFRGAFYRHLRSRMPAVVCAMLTAFCFGIIHPVPLPLTLPLMALGFNFAMIREWRGSLIGPMVAHWLHNTIVLTLLLSVLYLGAD